MNPTRLPDGTKTEDPEVLTAAWREFAAPLEAVLGMDAYGCDPGVTYRSRDGSGPPLHLPTWAIQRINAALKVRDDVVSAAAAVVKGFCLTDRELARTGHRRPWKRLQATLKALEGE